MVSSTSRALRLITDLLDFTEARIGDGLKVARVPVDLHRLVADSVDELATAFHGRTLDHRHTGVGDCTLDPDRIVQLIGNLVGNAMSYGARDRPVTVASSIEGEMLEISVHNEGSPIAASIIPSLFEPMVRGATGARSRGVGLGARSRGGQRG